MPREGILFQHLLDKHGQSVQPLAQVGDAEGDVHPDP